MNYFNRAVSQTPSMTTHRTTNIEDLIYFCLMKSSQFSQGTQFENHCNGGSLFFGFISYASVFQTKISNIFYI